MSNIRSNLRGSARNAFGKEQKRNSIRALQVEVSKGADRLVDATATRIAVPWKTGGSGAVALLPRTHTGPIAKAGPALLTAHQSDLTALQLAPLDADQLATGAREECVKIWSLPSLDDASAAMPTTPAAQVPLPRAKRVDLLEYHPIANGIIAAGTGGLHVAVCDTVAESVVVDLAGASDRITGMAWSDDGQQLAIGGRDKMMRIFDARSGQCAASVEAHSSAKGFALCFVPRYDEALGQATMSAEPLCSVGFGRGQRELALWDQRKIDTPLLRSTIDHQSGWLQPFYDVGTGVLFLGGKGRDIYYYEVNASQSMAHLINKHTSANAFSALAMLPKRVVDFKACELARFLQVSANNIETLSIYVPRKNKDVFHDDVYQRVPSGKPSLTSTEWAKGENRQRDYVSLRPSGMKSVYDLSVADGGKERSLVANEGAAVPVEHANAAIAAADAAKVAVSTDKSGAVQRKQPGWLYTSFDHVHAQLSRAMASLFLFRDAKAASPLQTLVLKSGSVEPVAGTETDFELVTRDNVHCILRVADATARDSWLASIRLVISASDVPPSPADTPDVTPGSSPPSHDGMIKRTNSKLGAVSPSSSSSSSSSSSAVVGKLGLPKLSLGSVASTAEHDDDMLMSHREALVTPRIAPGSTKRIEGDLKICGTSFRDKETKKNSEDAETRRPLAGASFASLRYGILAFYRDKKACRENVREPIDSLHIDRLLAVRVVEDQDAASAAADDDDEDGSGDAEAERVEAAASTSKRFRIVTADRIIDVEAASADARARWVRGLSVQLDDSGDVRRTRQGLVFEYAGFMFGWQTRFLAVYGDELLLFTSQTEVEPLKRLALANLDDVELTSEKVDGEQIESGLMLRFTTGTTLRVRAPTVGSAKKWADCLSFLHRFASDVLATLLGDVADIDEADVRSDQDMNKDHSLLDMSLVKRGDQPILVQLYNDARRLRLFQVPIGVDVLREDCCYVLDLGRSLWQWNGRTSARILRAKGMDLMNRINKKERGGLAKVWVMNDGKSMESEDAPVAEFWRALGVADGCEPAELSAATTLEAHRETTITYAHPYVLAVTGDLSLCFVHGGATPARDVLLTENAYIVDCLTELYVWVGKAAALAQRKRAMRIAKLMMARRDLDQRERRAHTGAPFVRLMRVIEDGEPMLFKERFVGFPGMLPINMVRATKPSKVAKRRSQPAIDVAALLAAPRGVPPDDLVSSAPAPGEPTANAPFPTAGDGVSVKVWVIDDFDKYAVRHDDYGIFYASDSYVVLLTYERRGKPAHVIFFHQGRDSSVSEKGTSAYMTRMMQNELQGDCTQIRVLSGKEPREFIQLFDNTVIVRRGAYPRDRLDDADKMKAKKNVNPNIDSKAEKAAREAAVAAAQRDGRMLLHVQGFADDCIRSMQTGSIGEIELTHNGVFLLVSVAGDASVGPVYRWTGAFAHDFEKACAERTLRKIYGDKFGDVKVVDEKPGSESADFWQAMGGAPPEPIPQPEKRYDTRMYELSSATGVITVDPIPGPLRQDDLSSRNVYLVDVGTELFLWFGERSLHKERQFALHIAKQMSALATDPANPSVYVTRETRECPMLKLAFHAWCNTRKGKLLEVFSPEQDPLEEVLSEFSRETYSYHELLETESLPATVDRTKLEDYLPDDEFETVFGMTRAKWETIPSWKKPDLKRKANLY